MFFEEMFKSNKAKNKANKETKLGLTAPWVTYCNMLKQMFEKDPKIKVSGVIESVDPEGLEITYVITITAYSHKKYNALKRFLPEYQNFGNVTVRIDILDAENGDKATDLELMEDLFCGNPIIEEIATAQDPTGTELSFAVFKPEVVQFFNDDIRDYNGLWSGLMQDIADMVFVNADDINFCTGKIR